MSGISPPRHRNAEDLSGRQRAERRGGISEAEYLTIMRRAGFVLDDVNASPFFTFTHPILGDRAITAQHGESFSRTADRAVAMVAAMEIVKVQKPLFSSGPEEWLIYPRGRKWQLLLPRAAIPMGVRDAVDATLKAFFYARRIGNGRVIHFGGPAPEQTW